MFAESNETMEPKEQQSENAQVGDMKRFIETIAKHLVDKPEEVSVTEIDGERTIVYELRVGYGDLGKVIGKRGQTAKSIRILLAAASAKRGKRAVLEILE